MILQAGDSDEGREFAAADRRRDLHPARHAARRARPSTPTSRAGWPRYGRSPDELKILPAATFVLGDTDAEAQEQAARHPPPAGQRRRPRSSSLEQLWNRDLSDYDPDGPLPDVDPIVGEHTIIQGRASVRMYRDPLAIAERVARSWPRPKNLLASASVSSR